MLKDVTGKIKFIMENMVILNCNNKFHIIEVFYCVFNQLNTALVSIRDVKKKNRTDPKLLNYSENMQICFRWTLICHRTERGGMVYLKQIMQITRFVCQE